MLDIWVKFKLKLISALHRELLILCIVFSMDDMRSTIIVVGNKYVVLQWNRRIHEADQLRRLDTFLQLVVEKQRIYRWYIDSYLSRRVLLLSMKISTPLSTRFPQLLTYIVLILIPPIINIRSTEINFLIS